MNSVLLEQASLPDHNLNLQADLASQLKSNKKLHKGSRDN